VGFAQSCAAMDDDAAEAAKRPWFPAPPGRLIGRGHTAGEFLEAYDWRVLEHTPGFYRIEAHLPEHVKNVRKHLYGGFTPAYIDLVAARTAHSVLDRVARGMMTVNMRVDYFDPVAERRFILEGRVVHTRGRVHLVEVLFKDLQGKLLVFSVVTLRQLD
jgi:acyl-coenzyme A thioesterase PaaI-like protein